MENMKQFLVLLDFILKTRSKPAMLSDGCGPRPGPEPGFFVGPEARLLEKGSSPARACGQKPGGFEGLLKYDFFEKNTCIILGFFY